jgi:hypothetical protein
MQITPQQQQQQVKPYTVNQIHKKETKMRSMRLLLRRSMMSAASSLVLQARRVAAAAE